MILSQSSNSSDVSRYPEAQEWVRDDKGTKLISNLAPALYTSINLVFHYTQNGTNVTGECVHEPVKCVFQGV